MALGYIADHLGDFAAGPVPYVLAVEQGLPLAQAAQGRAWL